MQITLTDDNKLKVIAYESDVLVLKKLQELINYNAASAQLITFIGKGVSELIIQQSETDEMIEWKKSKPKK